MAFFWLSHYSSTQKWTVGPSQFWQRPEYFFFVLLAYLIQVTYIVRIHIINIELAGHQCEHHLHLQVTCLFVFSMAGFQELRDCMDFLGVLYWCPTGDYTNLQSQHGAVLADESHELRQRNGWRKMFRRNNREPKSWNAISWKLEQMPLVWKVTCAVVVFIPRLMICGALLRVAAGFIMRSTEEKMIVDTVAALFILEISSFIYNAFTTHAVKDDMAGLGGLTILTSKRLRVLSFVFVNFVYPLAVIGFSISVVWYLRIECADEDYFFSELLSVKLWREILGGPPDA